MKTLVGQKWGEALATGGEAPKGSPVAGKPGAAAAAGGRAAVATPGPDGDAGAAEMQAPNAMLAAYMGLELLELPGSVAGLCWAGERETCS